MLSIFGSKCDCPLASDNRIGASQMIYDNNNLIIDNRTAYSVSILNYLVLLRAAVLWLVV